MTNPTECLSKQFFESIADAKQLLRLFDFLPDTFLYVKDSEGRFVGMNEPWVKMRGAQSANELVGKSDADLHPLYWARQYQEEDRRVMHSGRELPDQVWLVPAGNGKLTSFVSSKIPIRDKHGLVLGIAGVMYPINPESTTHRENDPIKQATEIIASEFRGSIEVKQIAERVGLSTSQLGRRFQDRFQVSPSEYLKRVRIHEASRLLADTDKTLGEVALDCGFYDQAHFTRTFKQQLSMTPKEFRRELGQ